MKNEDLECASGDRKLARAMFKAIQDTERELQARGLDTSRINSWTTRRLADGSLIGVPTEVACPARRKRPLSVAEAARITESRLR